MACICSKGAQIQQAFDSVYAFCWHFEVASPRRQHGGQHCRPDPRSVLEGMFGLGKAGKNLFKF